VDLFHFVPGYRHLVFDEGKEPLFLLLLAFVVAFLCARGYARGARKRGWGSGSIGGVHLHHEVVGIILMLIAGIWAFAPAGAGRTEKEFAAILFGVGAALVLDEFALVFYLRDVYWSNQGRDSVDAAILAVLILGLMLVSTEPFGLADPVSAHRGRFILFVVFASNVVVTAITFLKSKPFLGVAAIALPPFGWLGAARLAKPRSPWARWFYSPAKTARAESRVSDGFAGRFQRGLVSLIGGD
jgi:hypothetical protein